MSRRRRETGTCNTCFARTYITCPNCGSFSCSYHTLEAGAGDACRYCRKRGRWVHDEAGQTKWVDIPKENAHAQ